MGDRCVLQVIDSRDPTRFSPAVYVHWVGDAVPQIMERTIARMAGRQDIDYVAARLVQECALVAGEHGNLGLGMWNVDHVLTADDSHGDAGCALLDVAWWRVQYVGGYLARAPAAA